MKAPNVATVCKGTGFGKTEHILGSSTAAEEAEARCNNAALVLAGDLEGDTMAVRKTYVSALAIVISMVIYCSV